MLCYVMGFCYICAISVIGCCQNPALTLLLSQGALVWVNLETWISQGIQKRLGKIHIECKLSGKSWGNILGMHFQGNLYPPPKKKKFPAVIDVSSLPTLRGTVASTVHAKKFFLCISMPGKSTASSSSSIIISTAFTKRRMHEHRVWKHFVNTVNHSGKIILL